MSPWSNRKPALGPRSTSKKHPTSMSSKPEPAIWSCDTGQWISRYDSFQLNIIWMSNIKDVCSNPGLHDLVSAGWPPCCIVIVIFIVVIIIVVIHAASHVDLTKRVCKKHVPLILGNNFLGGNFALSQRKWRKHVSTSLHIQPWKNSLSFINNHDCLPSSLLICLLIYPDKRSSWAYAETNVCSWWQASRCCDFYL